MSTSRVVSTGDTKVLRFNNQVPIEVQRTKYQSTAKYDRKLVKKRLEIEEWMHNELKILYRCKDDDDYGIEIDVDILMGESDETEKRNMLKELLKGAADSTEEFIMELLQKVTALEEALHNAVKKATR
eukprot:gene17706-19475_t